MDDKYTSGFGDFDRLLAKLPVRIENKVLQASTLAGGKPLVAAVKAATPAGADKRSPASQKYGSLKSNITQKILKKGKKAGRRGVRVHTGDAFWGRFIEFGARNIKPRPWFSQAIQVAKGDAFKQLGKELGKGIEREARILAGLRGKK